MNNRKNNELLKIKKRILKQTHDIKLAESLNPISKILDEVNESTQKLGDVIKGSQPQTPQLAIESTPTHQPIENNEDVINDTELENTLKIMKKNSGSFKTIEDEEHG